MEIKRLTCLIVGLLLILAACEVNRYEASPLDPRLPAYSATGTNTAGAYIDGYSWLAGRSAVEYEKRFNITTFNDKTGTEIIISKGYQIIENDLVEKEVGFYLGDLNIRYINQLNDLKNTVITLDGTVNYGMLIHHGDGNDTINHGTGKLYIREVAASENSDSYIISGTFGFDIHRNGHNHTIHSGRFDYRITNGNFIFKP